MSQDYPVNPGWRLLFEDMGLRAADILRRARLPEDLFARTNASLSTEEYFRLWRGLEAEANDPLLPLRIGSALTVESFDPPIFAALCSPNLRIAVERLAAYKRLIGPMRLQLEDTDDGLEVGLRWIDPRAEPPRVLVATELVFFVQLARIATRERIVPTRVDGLHVGEGRAEYRDWFGREATSAPVPSVSFSKEDAARPFLTANDALWQSFEPHLRARLDDLDVAAPFAERVRAALLELLPAGAASVESVARKLGTSTRTLQRRLSGEESTFQSVLDATREQLARHYLRDPRLTGAEISYLLGYDDPNSFFRAFHAWTGSTPEQVRAQVGTT